jgi:hypothetical protein
MGVVDAEIRFAEGESLFGLLVKRGIGPHNIVETVAGLVRIKRL